MRGVLMKIGQMASYIGDGLSPAVRQILARRQRPADAPSPGRGVTGLRPAPGCRAELAG